MQWFQRRRKQERIELDITRTSNFCRHLVVTLVVLSDLPLWYTPKEALGPLFWILTHLLKEEKDRPSNIPLSVLNGDSVSTRIQVLGTRPHRFYGQPWMTRFAADPFLEQRSDCVHRGQPHHSIPPLTNPGWLQKTWCLV